MSEDVMLSDRQKEAWRLTREMSRDEAAEEMGIARATLESHLDKCYARRKVGRETVEWFEQFE